MRRRVLVAGVAGVAGVAATLGWRTHQAQGPSVLAAEAGQMFPEDIEQFARFL